MRETRATPRALYVAIEGIDGAGKTTVAVEVYNRLVLSGVRCALVSEPYTDIVTRVFELLGRLDPLTEAYLFAADRVALHRGPLKRLLESREVVLSDRSYVASLAYQVVRGVPEELVESLNTPCSIPDRVYLLDVPVDVALSRLASRPVDESRK
ncbi:MAG: dTMP kinase, partial [Fervidicoccaceae archaeon]